MEMRKAMLLILPFLLVAFPTSAADPNQEGNWTRCLNTDPDLAVAGCTAVIAAGQGPTGKLAEAFFKRGVAYGRKGQDDRAIEDFDQAIKLNPNLAVAFLGRCALRPHLGQLEQALADCNEALRLRPAEYQTNPGVFIARGVVYLKLKDLDAAIRDFEAALKINPGQPAALYGRGLAKRSKGDEAGGGVDIAAALQVSPRVASFFELYGLAPSALAAERAEPQFDGRKWTLGWSQNQNGRIFEEYVLEGESVQKWSELVTIKFLPGLQAQTNPDIYEAGRKMFLVTVCPGLQWQSLSQTEAERMWMWSWQGCPGRPDQSELTRLVRTDKGFHTFHYAIRKAPMPDDKRSEWTEKLKGIRIIRN